MSTTYSFEFWNMVFLFFYKFFYNVLYHAVLLTWWNSEPIRMPNSGFDWITRNSYFTTLVEVFTNHILAENTFSQIIYISWTEHKSTVLKSINKQQIIQHCHNFKNILINNFFLLSKSLLFTELKITYWKDKAIKHSNIYLLCNLFWCYYSILLNYATQGNMICLKV